MSNLIKILAQVETGLYIALAIFFIFTARAAFLAWQEHRLAIFGLEKEITYRRLRSSLSTLLLLFLLGMTVFCLVTFVTPILPASNQIPTATVDLMKQATPTFDPDLDVQPTSVPQPPPGTEGCIPNRLVITSLVGGQQVSGQVTLIGTVDIPNFGFYKYEYTALSTEQWSPIAAGRDVVREGTIGLWDTSQLTPGDYQLRLVATDNEGNELPPCVIPVRVAAP